uniref:Uncharacterized protein n=1 Tax=Physcomitrium patens TaxID=3218 RepID=A0A2K1IW90_PHYPA|nr:hypothetical protein PHYPA_025483 [Physcomitrium patens]
MEIQFGMNCHWCSGYHIPVRIDMDEQSLHGRFARQQLWKFT